MWISSEFKIYIVKEFQRLKAEEQQQPGWSAKRELSKINYRIHTDAIKQNLIPAEVTSVQASIIYANEADVLNVAMFGMTAKMWRELCVKGDKTPLTEMEYEIIAYCRKNDILFSDYFHHEEVIRNLRNKIPRKDKTSKILINQFSIHTNFRE